MKTIYLSLTVPDEVDAEEIVETMSADFFYNNRGTLSERFPEIDDIMSKIELRITDTDGLTEAERKQLWAILDHAIILDQESLMRAIAEAVVKMNPPPKDNRFIFDGGV